MAHTLAEPKAAAAAAASKRRATAAERWIEVLRIVIGFWFAKGVITKLGLALVGGFLPVPTASARWHAVMPKLLKGYAASTPIGWYHDFVLGVVLPHAGLFAQLTAFGETAVGLGLVLGLLTPVAATIGILLVLNYGLATLGAGPNNPGFHLVLLTGLLAVLGSGGGRLWGIDGLLLRRWRK